MREAPGIEEAADRIAGKEDRRDLSISYMTKSPRHGNYLLAVGPAVHIDPVLADLVADLKRVGILHNRHSAHQTDLAGHVLVPAVHTAVAVGQVGEDQKEERIHLVDQVGHLKVGHTDPIEV